MKYTPHLIFHLDNSIERGARVIKIMQEMEASPGEEK
jgi:ribosome-binding factor A